MKSSGEPGWPTLAAAHVRAPHKPWCAHGEENEIAIADVRAGNPEECGGHSAERTGHLITRESNGFVQRVATGGASPRRAAGAMSVVRRERAPSTAWGNPATGPGLLDSRWTAARELANCAVARKLRDWS